MVTNRTARPLYVLLSACETDASIPVIYELYSMILAVHSLPICQTIFVFLELILTRQFTLISLLTLTSSLIRLAIYTDPHRAADHRGPFLLPPGIRPFLALLWPTRDNCVIRTSTLPFLQHQDETIQIQSKTIDLDQISCI